MASFTHGIGKGLREPCSPYREAYVFGAELNQPKAEWWNCIPAVVTPTTSFNLSAISPGHEVVVALLGISGAPAGDYAIRFRWYRERDDALLYDYTFHYTSPYGGWLYTYSYIGYVAWEIDENGSYYALITVTGALSFSRQIYFTVSGIPEVVEPEPVPVGFFPSIVQWLNEASAFFYSLYLETLGWVFPFYYVSSLFLSLCVVFNNLAWNFSDFASAWYDVINRIAQILSWDTIWSYIKTVFPKIEELRDWFYNWGDWVGQKIGEWWSSASTTVLGWIAFATEGLDTLKAEWSDFWNTTFPQWTSQLDQLAADWGNFLTQKLPTLFDIKYAEWWWKGKLWEILTIVSSALKEYEPFWAGWQDWRDKVTEFFTDPEDWLYRAVDRIIERFW